MQSSITTDMFSVIVGRSQECLKLISTIGDHPLDNSFNFGGLDVNTVSANSLSEEVYLYLKQNTLFRLQFQIVVSEALEDCTQVLKMISKVFPQDQDIIQIGQDFRPCETSENQVHCPLKSGRSIAETKTHSGMLKKPVSCQECSFLAGFFI